MTETLHQLFEEVLRQPMPVFTKTTAFADLPGWDSVAHLALLLTVERHFNTSFTSAQMVSMKTIGEMVEALGGEQA
jgi:acyl carrier protein